MSLRNKVVGRGARTRSCRRTVRLQLSLERLDERVLLTTLLVTNAADTGAGTLRAAVATADANATQSNPYEIDVAQSTTTLAAATGKLEITAPMALNFGGTVLNASASIEVDASGVSMQYLNLVFAAPSPSSVAITIAAGASVTISNSGLDGGGQAPDSAGPGNAIVNDGSLTLDDTKVQNFANGVINTETFVASNPLYYTNAASALINNGGTVAETGAYYWKDGSNQDPAAPAIDNSGSLSEADGQIFACTGPSDSGCLVSTAGSVTLTTMTFGWSVGARAICVSAGSLTMDQGSMIDGNGNGALLTHNETVTLANVSITANQIPGGNNVVFDSSLVTITNCSITGDQQASPAPWDANAASLVAVTGPDNNFIGNGPPGLQNAGQNNTIGTNSGPISPPDPTNSNGSNGPTSLGSSANPGGQGNQSPPGVSRHAKHGQRHHHIVHGKHHPRPAPRARAWYTGWGQPVVSRTPRGVTG